MSSFPVELIPHLRRLSIQVAKKKTGVYKGQRRSNKFGSSLEFTDFRLYQPGDDVRQIDWNLYARTSRHHIKRFLDELEIKAAIYLDCSSSMRSVKEKWERAKQIAAACSFICLAQDDQLSFVPVSSSIQKNITRKGSNYAKAIVSEIMNLEIRETTTAFTQQAEKVIQKGKQIHFFITDGLEPLPNFEKLIRKIAATKSHFIVIQVLSSEELAPRLVGDVNLIDIETGLDINVSITPKRLRLYEQKILEHNLGLKKLCHQVGGQYILIDTKTTVEDIVMQDFKLNGIVH